MPQAPLPNLHPTDFAVMAVYFMAILGIGFKFSRKTGTTEGYFLGDKSTPSWVLGLSMISAKISSVTFLALPAAAFVLDWRLFVPNLSIVPVALFAVWILVPFFRRAAHTTAFEYLHRRFGSGIRLYGAVLFLVGQALRLGSVIYLVAIPIQMFTGIPAGWIMLVVGGFCAVYTIAGGIQAVIWTDALQAIILYFGGAAALVIMILGIPGGLPEIFRVAGEHEKFSMGALHWNIGERTFWTMAVVGLTNWVNQYTSDQVLIQRYLAAKDLRQARMAGLSSAFLCLPTWAFFFFLGTSLYVYYQAVPDAGIAGLPADNVFPYFILTRMPDGLTGLVIAGVLSAAMGSLSAALNSFSTVAVVDIVRPYLFRNHSDHFYALMAKWLTSFAALLMFGIGMAFSVTEKESFVDLSQQLFGFIGGMVPGFFLLGLFVRRVSNRVVWQVFPVAFLFNVYLVLVNYHLLPNFLGFSIHPYWVSTLVIGLMLVCGLILSRLQRIAPETRPGLTLFPSACELEKPAPINPQPFERLSQ